MAQFALKTSLPAYLRDEERKIEAYAKGYGLDFFPTMFEVLSCQRFCCIGGQI